MKTRSKRPVATAAISCEDDIPVKKKINLITSKRVKNRETAIAGTGKEKAGVGGSSTTAIEVLSSPENDNQSVEKVQLHDGDIDKNDSSQHGTHDQFAKPLATAIESRENPIVPKGATWADGLWSWGLVVPQPLVPNGLIVSRHQSGKGATVDGLASSFGDIPGPIRTAWQNGMIRPGDHISEINGVSMDFVGVHQRLRCNSSARRRQLTLTMTRALPLDIGSMAAVDKREARSENENKLSREKCEGSVSKKDNSNQKSRLMSDVGENKDDHEDENENREESVTKIFSEMPVERHRSKQVIPSDSKVSSSLSSLSSSSFSSSSSSSSSLCGSVTTKYSSPSFDEYRSICNSSQSTCLDLQSKLPPLVVSSSESLDAGQRILLNEILEKRQKLEALKKQFASEASEISKLERLLQCRVAHVESLGSMLCRKSFRLATFLSEFCGAAVLGALASVALECKEGVYSSGAAVDLTSLHRKRFSFSDLSLLSSRQGFKIIGVRLPMISTYAQELPNDAIMACLTSRLRILDFSNCRGLVLDERDPLTKYITSCYSLRHLILNNTSVIGDIGEDVLKGKSHLRSISVVNCRQLTGDIGVFLTAANNEKTELLSSTDPDSSSSSSSSSLSRLSLSSSTTTRESLKTSQRAFQSLRYLSHVDLRKCVSITGKLADIASALECLTSLCLDESGVDGDIGCLRHRRGLRRLRLSGLQDKITGNLSTLSKHILLQELHLNDTKVEGKLEDVQDLVQLRVLVLDGLKGQLNGKISALQRLTLLREVRVFDTGVGGRLCDIGTDLRAITELRLHETGVWGHHSSLRAFSNLIVATLPKDMDPKHFTPPLKEDGAEMSEDDKFSWKAIVQEDFNVTQAAIVNCRIIFL